MKKTIVDFRWIFWESVFLFLTVIAIVGMFPVDEDVGWSVAVMILGIFLFLGYAIVFPNSFVFTHEGIKVRYCFGLNTFIYWSNVKTIIDCNSRVVFFPWWREYEIGYFETKIPFHEKAQIPKNRKTKTLLQKYCPINIEKH